MSFEQVMQLRISECKNFKVEYYDDGERNECSIIFTDWLTALKMAKSTKKQHQFTRVVGQEYDGKAWLICWCSAYDDRGFPLFRR